MSLPLLITISILAAVILLVGLAYAMACAILLNPRLASSQRADSPRPLVRPPRSWGRPARRQTVPDLTLQSFGSPRPCPRRAI
jgi:hypothetical protein